MLNYNFQNSDITSFFSHVKGMEKKMCTIYNTFENSFSLFGQRRSIICNTFLWKWVFSISPAHTFLKNCNGLGEMLLTLSCMTIRVRTFKNSNQVGAVNIYFSPKKISNREDNEDPSKTRTTPTTSIQFLCPGRIDDNTVYWDTNINTT